MVLNKKGFVKKFVEKPVFSNPINIGNYLINSSLIKRFKSNEEIESSFLPKLTKKGLLVSYEHKGYFYSINDKKELIAAKKKIKKYVKMKNILVTGGFGLLGKPLVSFLRKKK